MKGRYSCTLKTYQVVAKSPDSCKTLKEDLTISDSSLEAQYTGTDLRLESSLEANLGTVNRFCKKNICNIK